MKYENLLIGDFIFSMGFAACQLEIQTDNRIDLLQQTPGDSSFGDLLGKIGGRNFIMEFKRNSEMISSEKKKPSKDFLLKNEIDDSFKLLSLKCHFMAYGNETQLGIFEYIYLNPYYGSKPITSIPQNKFFEKLNKELIGVNKAEMDTYLSYLAKNATTKTSSSSTASILVNYLKGRQPIVIEIKEGFTLEQKIVFEIVPSLQMDIQKSKGKSNGIGR